MARSTSSCNAPAHEPTCPANGWLSQGSALASRVIVPAIRYNQVQSGAIRCNQVHSGASGSESSQLQSIAINCNQVHSIAVPVASLTETESTPRTARAAISILSASRPLCSGGAISGNEWQSVAISGNQWRSVAISGDQWRSVAISGNQWQSELLEEAPHLMRQTISGNQWRSVAIESPRGSTPPPPHARR